MGKSFSGLYLKTVSEVDTWQGYWLYVVGVQCHSVNLDLTL